MKRKMRILFIDWNGYGNEDLKDVFQREGHIIYICTFSQGINTSMQDAECMMREHLDNGVFDFAFSLNYFPVVSEICQKYNLPYISWVYDSPYIHVYSYTVLNPCNYIFLFDYAVYEELAAEGIKTVRYLPLGVNSARLLDMQNNAAQRKKWSADISFVGSLYDEPKHRLYDKFNDLPPYTKGYLDAVINAQRQVYGYNFLKDMISDDILSEMQKVYPTDPNANTVMSPEALYADYVLARQVTALERREILTALGQRFSDKCINLYTNNKAAVIQGVHNGGRVDYYNEMPYVFKNSKINLNITLRSIKTGIPLRAFDIMGCGGFLLTNYQEELLQYFEPEADLVFYDDYDDLLEKIDYYLTHEDERIQIAENGCRKVHERHSMELRVREMIDMLEDV